MFQWYGIIESEVRANAETPADARQAKEFGAEGIGLVRTEHMFFEGQRIVAMRQMILATDEADRRQALDKLLVMQREDITELFRIMDGNPVTVRLLDPPLHEFIPHTEAEMALVAKAAGVPLDRVRRRAAELQGANPMLGHRGCRLAITYPEICEMQARAIFEAAAEVGRSSKKLPVAEVMVPLVATVEELKLLKGVIEKTADAVKKEQGITFTYKIGTMIELPRAALQAGRLAEMAEFFSFGTNDLTQTTYGLSRDDAGSFLPEYKAKGIVEHDPFVSLDPDGVGELITMAVQRGRSTRPEMKMGICGEHGGDPASIEVCEKIGLDYVSCSPFRVPVARLAAAQSALKTKGEPTKQSSTKKTKPRVQNFGPWWARNWHVHIVQIAQIWKLFKFVLINSDRRHAWHTSCSLYQVHAQGMGWQQVTRSRFCEHHFGNEEFRSVAVSCLHLKNFKEGAARNFQQEGLWLYSTKKGMMQAAVAEGCAFFPVFLSRFFLIFFPGKHRDWVKVFHDRWCRTNHFDCRTDFGEHLSNHFICWVRSLEPWANKVLAAAFEAEEFRK